MFEWMKNVSFYRSWQSEKARREYYEQLSKTWMNKALEQQEQIINLKAALANCDGFNPPSIGEGVVMTSREVQDVIEFLDTDYLLAPIDDIVGLIIPFNRRKMKGYISEFRDCDNFGFFQAAATSMWFGVNCIFPYADWAGGHMYNMIVPAEGELYIHEPQTSQTWAFDQFRADSMHTLRGGKVFGF